MIHKAKQDEQNPNQPQGTPKPNENTDDQNTESV